MSVRPLASLQRHFLAWLRDDPDELFSTEISNGKMPREVGLNIYTHAYSARLRETLEHDHPVLGTYLGDGLWDTMCCGYIAAHPSRYRSLRDFGANLPGYLAEADGFHAQPQIAELAMFERRLLDSFDAADDERADWVRLLELPEARWPALRLRFHPSLKLHRVLHNSVEIWRAIKDGQVPPPARAAANTDWALWRDVERVSRFRSIEAVESAAVNHCLHGGDFIGLCELLMSWHPVGDVPQVALDYLSTWCAEGWISHWNGVSGIPPVTLPISGPGHA